MSGVRFTAYFSPREDKALRMAEQTGRCSRNLIVRLAVRSYLGLDKLPQLSQLSDIPDAEKRESA